MIEHLMGFVDELEKGFNKSSRTINSIGDNDRKQFDDRYLTLVGLKKFILEDMLVYFIDRTIEGLRSHKPNNFLIQAERRKLVKFCKKYEGEYLKPKEIIDYFDSECQSNYEKAKKRRETQRN